MKTKLLKYLLMIMLLCINILAIGCGYKYDITNEYFRIVSKTITHNYNPEVDENCPQIYIKVTCPFDLVAIKANIKLYDSNEVIYEVTVKKEGDFLGNDIIHLTSFITRELEDKYKKIECEFIGSSKNNSANKDATCTVTFIKNNGDTNVIKNVKIGQTVDEINSPYKEHHNFDYWCTDQSLNYKYDFNTPVLSDIVLYAKYSVDYADLTNLITTKIMKSNVTVYAKNIDTIFWGAITIDDKTFSGSGIIFYEADNGYYYVLTNNHVTVKRSGWDKVKYTIEDYLGNKYEATAICMSSTYDLAVLRFKKNSTLNVIELGTTNPINGTEVVSLGQPKGQTNAISYGKILRYVTGSKLNNCEDYQSNVRFEVIKHNAYMRSGSSGGALLNTDLKLIGINYALNDSDDFQYGLSIPISKINEYLKEYFWD